MDISTVVQRLEAGLPVEDAEVDELLSSYPRRPMRPVRRVALLAQRRSGANVVAAASQ